MRYAWESCSSLAYTTRVRTRAHVHSSVRTRVLKHCNTVAKRVWRRPGGTSIVAILQYHGRHATTNQRRTSSGRGKPLYNSYSCYRNTFTHNNNNEFPKVLINYSTTKEFTPLIQVSTGTWTYMYCNRFLLSYFLCFSLRGPTTHGGWKAWRAGATPRHPREGSLALPLTTNSRCVCFFPIQSNPPVVVIFALAALEL